MEVQKEKKKLIQIMTLEIVLVFVKYYSTIEMRSARVLNIKFYFYGLILL